MPLYVANNFNALVAQNALTANATALAQSEQRLATGLRINSAGDDAAGLAISTRLTNQINGLSQASLNANSGVSLAQVTQGALGQVTANLQRIRTLAVQSENSTNSATDRQAIDSEVQQRLQEIQRIATQTAFNGTNLLDGTFSGATFQVGANVGQTISLGAAAQNVQTSTLGAFLSNSGSYAASGATLGTYTTATAQGANGLGTAGSSYTGVDNAAIAANTLTINGTAVQASSTYATSVTGQDNTSAYAKALAINASGISGVTATAATSLSFDPTVAGGPGAGNFLNVSTLGTNATAIYSLQINGTTVISQTFAATGTITTANAASLVNSQSNTTGVSATVNANGTLSLAAADGRNIGITEAYSGAAGTVTTNTISTIFSKEASGIATALSGGTALTYRGAVTLNSGSNVVFNAGTVTNIGQAAGTTALATSSSLSAQNVQTVAAASNTLFSVDSAISTINAYNATWGAVQNRLTSSINNIGTTVQNLTTANGRITNADFAAESTNLATASVIQQASTSILAQANSQAQQVLKLLQ